MAKQQHQYIEYGSKVNAVALEVFLRHQLQHGLQQPLPTPICIWGKHGIGKTAIVEALADDLGYQLAYIAPAQFEEMGDLIGLPTIEGEQTVFRAPEWVPTQAGPGILLIDDVNRADDRILRGIMQLLQRHALVSWRLPAKWQIVLTANPDGGDYSVTPMDDAMLTRMAHISLQFEAVAWAKWAEKAGIDARGINFVLSHQDAVTGQRTTPRTLVQFFEAIQSIEVWHKELALIQQLGEACLDTATVAAFLSFLQQTAYNLPEPSTILQAKDFEQDILPQLQQALRQKALSIDIFYLLSTRMANYLQRADLHLPAQAPQNVKRFLLLDDFPPDMRFRLASILAESPHPTLQQLLTDPQIGQILLDTV